MPPTNSGPPRRESKLTDAKLAQWGILDDMSPAADGPLSQSQVGKFADTPKPGRKSVPVLTIGQLVTCQGFQLEPSHHLRHNA